MESANLTTRTYTAQTCTLTVTTKPRSLPHLPRFDRPKSGDFTIQIDRTEEPGAEPICFNGQLDRLDKLQQSVSKYVAQLVAQFPIGAGENSEHNDPELEDLSPEPIPEEAVVSRLYPTAGIAKNLPGLRHKSPQLAPVNVPAPAAKESHAFSAASISKLLGRSNPVSGALLAPESRSTSNLVLNEVDDRSDTLPRLTVGDRPLEHKLYLSDNNAGRVLTLSQCQLFNLETTLKDYTNEVVTTSSVAPQKLEPVKTPKVEAPKFEAPKFEPAAAKFEAPEIEAPNFDAPEIEPAAAKFEAPEIEAPNFDAPEIEGDKIEEPEIERSAKFNSIATTSALSRLPNLPSLPSKTSSRSYDYGDESRPALMSAIPWVAAAAIVVGVPLFLFGSNPNLLKESMAKVKMPNDPRELFNTKKSNKPEQPAANPTGDGVANAATPALPKPWETKPVVPPASTPIAALPGAPIPQPGASEISIAPLPPSIMNITEQGAAVTNIPSNSTPATPNAPISNAPGAPGAAIASTSSPQINQIPPSIAPNPLSSPISGMSPVATKKQVATPGVKPSSQAKISNPLITLGEMPKLDKPTTAVANKSKTNSPLISNPTPVRATTSAPKSNPVKKVTSRNTNKVGVSPQPIKLPPAFEAIGNEPPATPPPFPAAKPEKLTPVKQPKKAVAKSNPKPVAVTKQVAKVTPLKNRQPKQPVIIVPVQEADPSTVPSEFTTPPGIPQTNTPSAPPIIIQPQLQSNNQNNNPAEDPSLKETKRYFQEKWRADSSQTSTLQYVVQVNAKSGLVRSVNPQGEAATTYLNKTNVLKAGQKLVPSTTTGEGDQKIRVLLHPDGKVDAFVEP